MKKEEDICKNSAEKVGLWTLQPSLQKSTPTLYSLSGLYKSMQLLWVRSIMTEEGSLAGYHYLPEAWVTAFGTLWKLPLLFWHVNMHQRESSFISLPVCSCNSKLFIINPLHWFLLNTKSNWYWNTMKIAGTKGIVFLLFQKRCAPRSLHYSALFVHRKA